MFPEDRRPETARDDEKGTGVAVLNAGPSRFSFDLLGADDLAGSLPAERSQKKAAQEESLFRRGDANASGEVNIADAVFTLEFLFSAGVQPDVLDSADANDDGLVNIADPIAILAALFAGEEEDLPPPGMKQEGEDPTEDDLDDEEEEENPGDGEGEGENPGEGDGEREREG